MKSHLGEGKRTVYHADAIAWLKDQPSLSGCSIVTSLPDLSEFPKLSLDQWKEWFVNTAALVLSTCPDDGITIFYQTDLKKEGAWIDKGFLCQKAAEQVGQHLIMHKIICRAPAGVTTFGRPGYSHLLGFSKSIKNDTTKSFPDILPEAGETTWTRGMGMDACFLACKLIMANTSSHTIVDPFCGHGTILVAANELGLNAIGVEHKIKNFNIAQTLTFSDLKNA